MSNRSNTELRTSRLIWTAVVGNLRPIDNRPVKYFQIQKADYQSAAGYQPHLSKLDFGGTSC